MEHEGGRVPVAGASDASALGPYTLLRLVIGLAGGILVFREIPNIFSVSGAVLILASCALAAGVTPPRLGRRVRDAVGASAAKAPQAKLFEAGS